MLELLATVDPMQTLLGMLWLFAAGMFPAGMMLGSTCSPCCNPCSLCTEGTLPETVTVTFDGLTDKTPGPDLISLSFSSCYGSGAAARVTAPGGDPVTDKGPIGTVSLTNAGSGYAKLGRVAPTITASGSGTGATLAVVLETAKDACNVDYWSVSSVTVSGGGTGYMDGEAVTFTESTGDSVDAAASATINTVRVEPTVEATVLSYGGGNGAALTATLTQGTDFNGRDVWSVSGITIDDGGTGYAEYDFVNVTATDGTDQGFFYGFVSSVDGNGAITGIDIYGGGEYYKATDEVESVTVTGGGIYYREDATEPPYVATVTVSISQDPPSTGTGASITATVEDDPESADFGKITGLTIANGGSDYLAWKWLNTKCCGGYYNAMSVVLQRSTTNPCSYIHSMCGVGNRKNAPGFVSLTYSGPSSFAAVNLVSETGDDIGYSQVCNTTFTADQYVTNCSVWDGVVFTSTGGATATVAAGGDYDPAFHNKGGYSCNICCKGAAAIPLQVSVSVQDNRASKGFDYTGDYVVDLNEFLAGSTLTSVLVWVKRFFIGTPGIDVSVGTVPCSEQTTTAFTPDAAGCDQCHYSCRFSAGVRISESGILDSEQTSSTYAYNPDDYCAACQPTPICGPVSQSETLCQNVFGGLCDFVVTVNAA